MSKLQFSQGELLLFNGKEYGSDDGHTFELPSNEASSLMLSELPVGLSVALCDRVIGSRDLYRRQPYCSFENKGDETFMAQCEVAFVPESEDWEEETRTKFLKDSLSIARQSLKPLADVGTLLAACGESPRVTS